MLPLPTVLELDTSEKFKKTNEAIGLRVSKGHLSFISRKLFNVMVLHAQKLGVPGVNAPIDTETAKNYFWVPANEIQRAASYNSNDTKLLKEALNELQDIKIISENEKEWTSEQLVASVKLVNPAGLKRKGGRLWVGFAFPPEVLNLVMNPRTFTTLSLYYMTVLRTNAGLALYEAAKKHAWKTPVGMTERMPWEDWRDYLEGMSGLEMPSWKHQYKFFKDRVLKKAVIEVNTLTDLDVEAIEYKQGKRVIDLQFRVSKKTPSAQALPIAPIIDSSLIDQLESIGLSKQEAEAIFATQAENDIRSALTYTQERINDSRLPELHVPAAYFKDALRRNYAGTAKRTAAARQTPKVPALHASKEVHVEAAVNRESSAERTQMLSEFDGLDDAQRRVVLDQFAVANPALAALTRGNPKAKVVRNSLAGWLLSQATA